MAARPEHPTKRERTTLLHVMTAVMALGSIALVALLGRPLVSWGVLVAVIVPWVAMSILLRLTPKTLGKERPVLDWWSVPHAGAGLLLGLFGFGAATVLIIAALWEIVELIGRVDEYPTNRVADVLLAFGGWILANALAGGTFGAW